MSNNALKNSNDRAALTVLKQLTDAAERKALLERRKEREIETLNRRALRSAALRNRLELELLKIIDRYIHLEMKLDAIVDQNWNLIRAWGRGDSVIVEKLRMKSTISLK